MISLRKKYSVYQQIENLKNKNIKFEIMDEHSALQYLTYNTYYFKIKSFAKSLNIMNQKSNIFI